MAGETQSSGQESQPKAAEKPKTEAELQAEKEAAKAKIESASKAERADLLKDVFGDSARGFSAFLEGWTDVIQGFWTKLFGTGAIKLPQSSATTYDAPKKSNEKHKGKFADELKGLMKEFGLQDSGNARKNFFEVAVKLAKEVEAAFGIPYQVVVAQSCLESGFGLSGLSQKNFNCFGIKAQKGYKGESANYKTDEYFDGKTKSRIKSNFRSYSSIRESFMDYGRFLKENPRYAKAFEYAGNPKAFLESVIKAGYATSPTYVASAVNALAPFGLSLG
ncbi:glucosaminidase domain-containing protein [Candidatus Peregrinibacteria bacterium]|nr:glucosaminidase domain-containing protein [Candidatus Peregrinibacteria bacterium]